MLDPAYHKKQGGLYAVIRLVLTIHEDGHLEVVLEIESENRSDETIHLNKSYRIPIKKGASKVEAYDLNNKTELNSVYRQKRGYVEVIFERGTVLPPHHKFTWRVSYTSFGFEKQTAEDEYHSHFFLDPQRSYKKIPIHNHKVYLTFIFKKRFDEDGKPLSLTLTEHNTLNIRAPIDKKSDDIECHYEPFDLARGEKIVSTFCRKERPASNEIDVAPPAPAAIVTPQRSLPKFLLSAWVFATPPIQRAIEELLKLFIGRLK
jgi:hypothetical protein